MNQSAQNYFSVQKPSETSSGPYTSPPPIGYPTRDAVVGDPPAAAVETNSKGINPEGIMSCFSTCMECIFCCSFCLSE
ncbi:unnamed protein product [Arabidopsis thaliana]|uniref:Uncharacterized protein n=1 Tax=Arabidopsis thaliana TaxID=3702 RepID=A0A5S9XF29_ARATH|nr:unnamed protein product [Arabidopsis thaliana]